MKAPPGSDKYCAHYLNNPGGHCQVVGEKVSIFAPLSYTLLWKPPEFPIPFIYLAQLGRE